MPPMLAPRSVQVARTLKGLKKLGWSSTVVTSSLKDLRGEVVDPQLTDVYGANFTLVPVSLPRVDQEFGPRLARWRSRWSGESALSDDALFVKCASAATSQQIRAQQPAALVTFAQPWGDHLVGLGVRGPHPRLPWVAHFSDPWTDSMYSTSSGGIRDRELANEAAVIEQADRIVFTNDHAADLVMRKYAEPLRRKVRVIPHAMDLEVFPAPAVAPRSGPLRMAHIGNLFVGRRTARAVFDAIEVLKTRRPLASEFQLLLLGEGSGLNEAQTEVFVRRLDDVVSFRDRVPYFESLEVMRDSDVLLLIDSPAATNVFLPSKLVDYLMAGRPILGLTPHIGASADLLRRVGGRIVDPGDATVVTATIEELLAARANGRDAWPPTDPSAAAAFGLDATAAQFASVLDEIVKPRR